MRFRLPEKHPLLRRLALVGAVLLFILATLWEHSPAQAQGPYFSAQMNKSFSPISIPAGGTSTLSVSIYNPNPFILTLSAVPPAWTDTLPAGMSFASLLKITNSCGGSVSAVGSSLSLSGGTVAAQTGTTPGSCTVTVDVTSTTAGNLVNTIPANTLKAKDPSGTIEVTNSTPASATLQVNAVQPPSLSKTFAPNTVWIGQTSTLTIQLTNNDGNYPLTAVAFADSLPSGLQVASSPGASTSGCGGAAVFSPAPGDTTLNFSGGVVAVAGACTLKVQVTSSTPGIYTDNIPANAVQTQQGVTNGSAAVASLNVQSVGVAKAFAPIAFQQGGQSAVTITLSNPTSSAYTGVSFADSLPAGLSVVPPAPTTTCGGSLASTGSSVSLSGGTIPGGSVSRPGTCLVQFEVSSSVPGTYTDSIPVGGLTTDQGASNVLAGTANLTVYGTGLGLGGSKGFTPSSIPVGGLSRLTITITAPADTGLTNLSLSDALPSGVQVATTPSAATSGCGTAPPPIFNPQAGDTSLTFTGGTVAQGGSCTLGVDVTSSTPGTVTDLISPVNISDTEIRDLAGSISASLNVSGLSVSKAFYPPVVGPNGISTLTISLANTNTSQLDNVSFSDTLPSGVAIASTPNVRTTCPNATITANAGTQLIGMSGGILPADVSGIPGLCTVSVDVIGEGSPGTYSNYIPSGTVSGRIHGTSLEVSNYGGAGAYLTIRPVQINVVKGFDPLTVYAASASTLTVQLSNPNNAALTGIGFTDIMPTGTGGGMIVANPPSPSVGTCGGTLSATPGATSFSYSGGNLAAYASCTLTLNVTMTVSANLTNTIPVGAVTSQNGASNVDPASASLTNLPGASVTKLFLQNPISAGTGNVSNLQITIENTGSTGLDGMGLTDSFPAGMTVATDVTASQCGGTVTGPAGAGSITLAGGSLNAGSSCTIQVEVTAPTSGNYQDCIDAGALQDKEGATNQEACDTLVVNPVLTPPSIAKSFSPNPIAAGGTSVLTFQITNPNADTALTGASFSDDFPAGLTVASVPNMAQCGGTVTSTTDSVSLTGGGIAAGKSCSIVVSVTAASAGSFTNTSGQVSSTNGGLGNTAADTLDVLGPPEIGKAFNPNSIAAEGTSVLTFTITNPPANPLALAGVGFTDDLPAGVTVASAPTSPQCGGTVASTSGSITLTGGTVAVDSSCTVQVTVTAAFGGTYLNTSGAVTSSNGGTGGTASDTLYVTGAGLTLQKTTSTPTYQKAGDLLSYTYTLTNTGDQVLYGPFKVQDNLMGPAFTCGTATSLDLGSQTSCTATYTVTSGDVTARSVSNTATATGWDAPRNGHLVTSNPSSVTVYLEALTLTKHTSTLGYHSAGDTLSYSYTLTNTGAVTLYAPFTVSDDHINSGAPFSCGPPGASLAPYANISCNAPALYTVSGTDVTDGSVTNQATATAQDAASGGRTVISPISSVTVYLIGAPSIQKAFSPNPVAVGQSSLLTFTITNPSTNQVALTGVGFTDNLPSGLIITTAPSSQQCGGSVTSTSTSVTLRYGTVVPGGTCTVTVSVAAEAGGAYPNTSGAVSSSNGGTGNTASATLTVVAPPAISKSFAPAAIVLGEKSTLTLTLTGPSGNPVPLDGVAFSDSLPTGLVVATPPGAATTGCGNPSFVPAAGATSLSFSGGTIQPGGTCTVTVSVTAQSAGTYYNATGAVSSSNGGTGSPSNTASLTVSPSADLSITKSDGKTGVSRGEKLTYVIVVRNAGPSSVTGASVVDALPSSLLNATWTCVAGAGANCSGSGSGDINDTVTIPVKGEVTYQLTATVSTTAETQIVNTASVLPPPGVRDSKLSNNSATDTDSLNLSPNAGSIRGLVFYDKNSDGVYDTGDVALAGVTIALLDQNGHVLTAAATGADGKYSFDNLLPGNYMVEETNPAAYPLSTTLDHVSVVLPPNSIVVVNFGDQKSTGAAISDPAVTKYVTPSVARIGDRVTYTITVGNAGNTDASNVSLSDTLPHFLDLVSITISPSGSFPIVTSGNQFTIQFGTVTPADSYTVTVVTKVNGLARSPGGDNTATVATTSPTDLAANDAASAYLSIVANRVLPATGFAPGRITVRPAESDLLREDDSGMRIEIPSLGVDTPVVGVPASGDTWDVTWLGNAVGYLEGTAFPTWSGNSVLTGHVYGADGLPGPFVNLKSLKWGDLVIIHFDGQRYVFEVQTSAVVGPDDTSAFAHEDLPWLTLVTCKDYNRLTNAYDHRVVVGAVLVKIETDSPAVPPAP